MTADQVNLLLDRLVIAFRWSIPEPELPEWHRALEPFDAEVAALVVDEVITSSRWLPKIGDLVPLIRQEQLERMEPAQTSRQREECAACEGTGWVDVEAPPGAVALEQPWSGKCGQCRGRGWRRGLELV